MKEYLQTLIPMDASPLQGRNIAREYLQARILENLQQMGAFVPLAFQGGTALLFLYGMRRFSEDLDFSWENRNAHFDFEYYMKNLKNTFMAEGYALEISVSRERVVHSALLKFEGLPYTLGLSPHRNENLSIKIEVDTNPPQGAKMESTLVRKYKFLNLYHYDRASLFAGKIHALLSRKFTKGRDVYDLMWYLSDRTWPMPNILLLRNALSQTGWKGNLPDESNWRSLLGDKCSNLDWKQVRADVAPFLEDSEELEYLTEKNILALLGK